MASKNPIHTCSFLPIIKIEIIIVVIAYFYNLPLAHQMRITDL